MPKNNAIYVFFIIFTTHFLHAQPFICDGKRYLTGTGLASVDIQNNNSSVTIIGNEDLSKLLIGFNIKDNYIYGFHTQTHELYQINALGKATSLGKITNIDPKYQFHAAEITPNGTFMLLFGRNDKGIDEIVYQISLFDTPYKANSISLLNPANSAIEDLAFSPFTGELFGYDSKNSRIVTFSRGSTYQINNYLFQSVPAQNVGALFFDKMDNLFSFGSAGLLRYDLVKNLGAILQVYPISASATADGASCPYTIRLKKSVLPKETSACGELTITYEIVNQTGENQGNIMLQDTLPKGFVISEVVKMPLFSQIVSGVGTNLVHIARMSPRLGSDLVVVKVKTNGVPLGTYASRAHISIFPLGLGITQPSDDPTTNALSDATSMKIIPLAANIRQKFPSYICYGDSAKIDLTQAGCAARWSDGKTNPIRYISKEGWQKVAINCGCEAFSDSFFVQKAKIPLEIELGKDKMVDFGETIKLDYTTVTSSNFTFQWKTNAPETTLSCPNCPEPSIHAQKNATISVFIKDENGCKASDSLHITVSTKRKIFAPNIFSPNNDGENDIFYLQGQLANIRRLVILNRWGNVVFERNNIPLNDAQNGWNGTFKGEILPPDTFIWLADIEFLDKVIDFFSGTVSLVK
jgi:gliding motility-associated-like protein